MRKPVNRIRIDEFLQELGRRFAAPGRLYLVGGTTLVYKSLRAQTADVDLTYDITPADHGVLIRAIQELKESLDMNIEEVSPGHFIPLPGGSEDRAIYVGRYGGLDVYHFDPYSSALSKIARGTEKDFSDVRTMLTSGLITWPLLKKCYDEILPRYGKESIKQDVGRFTRHFDVIRREFGASG